MNEPPFTMGVGAENYRLLALESDPWERLDKYRERRDEMLAVFKLGGHDSRLWRVNVPTGGEHGGRTDIQLLRCESCGQWTPLSKRPMRRAKFHDHTGRRIKEEQEVCTPVPIEDMKAAARAYTHTEKLYARGFVGAAFALLAFGILTLTLGAPPENRTIGYLGALLFATVSASGWVSFVRTRRSESRSRPGG